MKKFLVIAMMATMTFSLSGCGGSSNTENTEIETIVEESTSSKVNEVPNNSTIVSGN